MSAPGRRKPTLREWEEERRVAGVPTEPGDVGRRLWEALKRWQRAAVDPERPGTYTQCPTLWECEQIAAEVASGVSSGGERAIKDQAVAEAEDRRTVGTQKQFVEGEYADFSIFPAAQVLRDLGDARVGAADSGYGAYFYDRDGGEILCCGGYESVDAAARAIPCIRVRAVLAAAAGHPDPLEAASGEFPASSGEGGGQC